jgi:ribose transport system permease protein
MELKAVASHQAGQGPAARNGFIVGVRKLFAFREASLAIIIVLVFAALSLLSPYFLTAENLDSVVVNLSFDAIMAVGMAIILVAGGFDLSVGSAFGFACVVLVTLKQLGVSIIPALFLTLGAATAIGVLNGFLITKVKVNALITTIGMLSVGRGLTYVIGQGILQQAEFPDWFLFIGGGHLFGIPVMTVLTFVVVLVGQFVLRRSASLRKLYFVGSNETAARLNGIRVDRVRWIGYAVCAGFAGVAAILTISRFMSSMPDSGKGSEMRVLAACIIGGLSLAGGVGSIVGAVFGVILLALIANAMILLDVPLYWQMVISGAILIIAVAFDIIRNRRKA